MGVELMRWCDDRWLKKITAEDVPEQYRKQYRPSPRQLKKRYPDLVTSLTRDGSRKAANQFWHDLQAEIRAATPNPLFNELIANFRADAAPIGTKKRRLQLNKIGRAVFNELQPARRQLEAMGLVPKGDEVFEPTLTQAAIIESVQDAVMLDELPTPRVEHDKTVAYWRDRWLVKRKTELETMSYNLLTYHLKLFVPLVGEATDVRTINEATIEEFQLHLADKIGDRKQDSSKISATYAWNVCTTVKGFLRYLYSMRLIELPRNLDSLTFDKPHREPVPIPLNDARKIVKTATGQLRTWILTMFNIAGYQSDLNELAPSEIDWKKGRVIRKRTKEKHEKNVPTVDHLLWRETFAGLKEFGNRSGERVFLHDGKPLVVGRSDRVAPAWDAHLAAIGMAKKYNLRQIRKTVATILGNKSEFKPYVDFYGGWSRGSMVDSAYFKLARKNMDAMTIYLGEQLGVK